MNRTIICIPTLNPGASANRLLEAISIQKGAIFDLILIDSGSSTDALGPFIETGIRIHSIPNMSFNHGATRQLALTLCPEAEIIIYMTQDAILASPDSIKNILAPFGDEKIGAVCGRQLANDDATAIAAHARLFNYPVEPSIKTKADIQRIGIKAAFLSDSFAAYRRTALMDVGGFPSDAIWGEDTYVAAKMLLAGWNIAYTPEATCYHSHNYSMLGELRRYFDSGVFHSRETWYLNSLGKAEGEGKRFVLSEYRYLMTKSPLLIPSAIVRTMFKYAGYLMGQKENKLPVWLKRRLSLNKEYWKA